MMELDVLPSIAFIAWHAIHNHAHELFDGLLCMPCIVFLSVQWPHLVLLQPCMHAQECLQQLNDILDIGSIGSAVHAGLQYIPSIIIMAEYDQHKQHANVLIGC